jgi:endonuclease YncB( thermonuclease family)
MKPLIDRIPQACARAVWALWVARATRAAWVVRCAVWALGIATAGMAVAAPKAAKTPQAPTTLHGAVRSVVDGDTVWFAPADGGAPLDVRLLDIDAPEICQAGGVQAKAWLAEHALRRPARLVFTAGRHDRYGRLLATLWVDGDEAPLNRRLVEEGHAWSLRAKWDRGPYVAQERMARALRRGLHADGDPALPPWDFRRQHGPCQPRG